MEAKALLSVFSGLGPVLGRQTTDSAISWIIPFPMHRCRDPKAPKQFLSGTTRLEYFDN